MTKLFKVKTQDEMTDSLAAFMPGGRVFASKGDADSPLRKYLNGLSKELFRIDEQMNLMSEDYDINLTVNFLEQWESAVGIPDDCFDTSGTIEQRRVNVLAKLAGMNLTTEQDFIDLAALYGITVTITQGADYFIFPLPFPISLAGPSFPLPFPIVFNSGAVTSAKIARFTMIVEFPGESTEFPIPFPLPFGFPAINLIRCLFEKSKPANVQIIFI